MCPNVELRSNRLKFFCGRRAGNLLDRHLNTAQKWPRTHAWRCVARIVSKGTAQRYELHSGASISGHSASVTVLDFTEEEGGGGEED